MINNRYTKFYIRICKAGINDSPNLNRYIKEANLYHARHNLISSIPRNEWLYFNNLNPVTNDWLQYMAILTDDMKHFDIYRNYENSTRQLLSIPTSDVFTQEQLKHFNLPYKKTVKSTTHKKATKTKSNTVKPPKKSRTTHTSKSSRTRKGRKATKAPKRKAKK